jgi:hypothetical protein
MDTITTTVVRISIAVIAVFAVLAAIRFIIGGPEDTWICSKGEWVMHGKPVASKPALPCR